MSKIAGGFQPQPLSANTRCRVTTRRLAWAMAIFTTLMVMDLYVEICQPSLPTGLVISFNLANLMAMIAITAIIIVPAPKPPALATAADRRAFWTQLAICVLLPPLIAFHDIVVLKTLASHDLSPWFLGVLILFESCLVHLAEVLTDYGACKEDTFDIESVRI
jgi:hypothetical protein